MDVGKTKQVQYIQKQLVFIDESNAQPSQLVSRDSKPAAQTNRKTAKDLSRAGIPKTQAEALQKALNPLWADLNIIIQGHQILRTNPNLVNHERQILNELSRLESAPHEIARAVMAKLLGYSNDIDAFQQSLSSILQQNTVERTAFFLLKTRQFNQLLQVLTKKSRNIYEKAFGSDYYKDLQFNKFQNAPLDKLHAARWVENLEQNLTNFIKKIRKNNSGKREFHKYLYLAKKAIETISPKETQVQPRRDGKSNGSGSNTRYENEWD
jgi:hypothetical protein